MIIVYYDDSIIFNNIKSSNYTYTKDDFKEKLIIEFALLISKTFVDEIKLLNLEIEKLENKIKLTSKTEFLYKIIDIQKSLINFEVGIRENNSIIKNILNMETIDNFNYNKEILHDLLVENKQAEIMISKATLMVDKLSELYSHVIDNNLNTIMKVLTSITIVLTIPTIISSLWGMNVSLPLENHPLGFLYLIILSFIVSIIILWMLKNKDYL